MISSFERVHFVADVIASCLLGPGRRVFDDMPPEHVDLGLVRVVQGPETRQLRYDVRR